MKIVKIDISDFGPLHNKSFDLGETITVIRGDNESGKSTLLLFIKFALYGIARKTRAISVSEAERAISRDTEKAAGSMTVLHEGKQYRIDRRLVRSGRSVADKLSVTDTESGTPIALNVSPGEYFLGIPCEVFESSCFTSQLGTSNIKGAETGSALQNLLSSADETIDTKKTLKLLESARIRYLHKDGKGGSIYELEEKSAELERRYNCAVEDNCKTSRLESDLARLEEKISEVSAKQRMADEIFSKINLLSAIKLFDKLREYETKREEYENKLREITDKATKNGKTPDRPYLSSLETVRTELSVASDEHEKASVLFCEHQKTANAKKFPDQLEKKLTDAGGIENMRSSFAKLQKKTKSSTALSVVLIISALLTGALGALFIFLKNIPLAAASFGVCALSVLIFVLILSSGKKCRSKLAELSSLIGTDVSHFEEALKKAAEQRSAAEQREKELSLEKSALAMKERLLSETVKKASFLLSAHAPIGSSSARDIIDLLDHAISEISLFCQQKDDLSNRISLLGDRIRSLSSDLSDYNEHQIRRKVSPDIFAMSESEIQNAKKEKNYYDLQLKALGEKKLSVERALLERKYVTESPFELSAKLDTTKEELEVQRENFKAVCTAIDAITEAGAAMLNSLSPRIRAASGEYLARVTDGKYDSVSLSDTLELSMTEDGFTYPADAFSTGTKDMAYLAMRLSILKLLPCTEAPPMLMDESFAMIDDTRAKKLLELLSEHCVSGGQCIIFTCHGREERLLDENGINYSLALM